MRPSRVFSGIPPHGAEQRIGLFGGSFNPPHQGHRLISVVALQRLQLDWVWWLVSPGNPLKAAKPRLPLGVRLQAAAQMAAHPRLLVTSLEAELGTTYTADLLAVLTRRRRRVRFVWIMGSDGLAQFHHWRDWREIAASVPVAVVNRPGSELAPLRAPAAQALASRRLPGPRAAELADFDPPTWLYLIAPRTNASSTALRNAASIGDVGRPGQDET